MNIITTKQNVTYVRQLINAKALNVVDSTEHTVTFTLSEKKFVKLRDAISAAGLNPYGIMAW